MPFNQLILPLLGGYIFVNHTYLCCYWASRHPKEHMLFLSAVAGAFLLVVARVISYFVALTDIGRRSSIVLHDVIPFPGIGTAILAFFLGFVFRSWFNRTWTKARAPLWLYAAGQFNKLEEVLFHSAYPVSPSDRERRHPWRQLILGLFAWHKVQKLVSKALPGVVSESTNYAVNTDRADPEPVMLCLKNRKVYVGYIQFALPMRAEVKSYLTMLPAWSGYRDKDTLGVVPTTNYQATYDYIDGSTNGGYRLDLNRFIKTVCIDDVESANLFDEDAFASFLIPDDAPSEAPKGEDNDLS
ncbi:hypothetical protein J2X57_001061 [Luteibacter sp. 1214]|uniref:hypothetical protein n=1 Tax=Luteibacter sp. 1214 TaxID=2817735 RepID=UPI00286640D0|nr:hypothetical protein [Luteibacter sp. 1214]MDR6641854.1 hypothetical protein [Luteibacter sp. 1214]